MPELPEVETVRRGLAPALEGRRIMAADIRRPDLRWPFPDGFGGRLEGRRIESVGRRAKFLTIGLDDGATWIAHLGMTGRFQVDAPDGLHDPGAFYHEAERLTAHDHVVLDLDDGARLTYNDPRRFGAMDLAEHGLLDAHPWLASLGIEPTGNGLSAPALADVMAGSRTPLKAALLDQRRVAGLGNIYVCEALNRARLSPFREARTLARKDGSAGVRAERLTGEIRAVLAEAIAAGGSTLRNFRAADGSTGAMQQRFRAYDREGESCLNAGCRGVIARAVQSGRSTFHCPVCQR
ncbi:MAG: bifunctional DNA-formamidopyrimidine glycosylase/DNA-(apurinic or apyrimidinic site) lyase [Pseudomonadota bacterium]